MIGLSKSIQSLEFLSSVKFFCIGQSLLLRWWASIGIYLVQGCTGTSEVSLGNLTHATFEGKHFVEFLRLGLQPITEIKYVHEHILQMIHVNL